MGRKKICLAPMEDARARFITFHKRRVGVMKKVLIVTQTRLGCARHPPPSTSCSGADVCRQDGVQNDKITLCTCHFNLALSQSYRRKPQAHELSILCGCDIVVLIVAEHDSERAVFEYSSKPVAEILETYGAHQGPVDVAVGSMV